MLPSEDDITEFIAVAPNASEREAFVFLEAANSVEQATDEYYENPNKYSDMNGAMNDSMQGQIESPPSYTSTMNPRVHLPRVLHTNQIIEASNRRARDEQEMQNLLQTIQVKNGIFNADIEPEHDTEYPCDCGIH